MAHFVHTRTISRCIALAVACSLIGCSMHPLPEDVSRAATFDIIERIRCEIREGLNSFAPNDPRANRIIENTWIGYDLDFRINETSEAASGRLEFKRPAFRDSKTGFFLDLSGAATKTRGNTRSFRILENLSEPRSARSEACALTAKEANPAYPITGATGLAEVVRTYVKLEMLTNLQLAGVDPKSEDKFGTVFSDELSFTTRLSVGARPKLELRTIQGDFRLSHTSLMGTASRDDVHSVTVALARKEGVDVDVRMLAEKLQRSGTLGMLAAGRTRAVAKVIQNDTDAATRVLLELQRRRNNDEDARAVVRVLGP